MQKCRRIWGQAALSLVLVSQSPSKVGCVVSGREVLGVWVG